MVGRPRSRRSRAACLLTVVVAPLVLAGAGCANSVDAHSQEPVSSPSASPSPTVTSGAAPCRTAELKVALGPGGVAAGSWAVLLEFTNQGPATCTMTSWPAVYGVTAEGVAMPADNRSGAMDGLNVLGVPLVTLRPGQQAGSDLTGSDVSASGACPPPFTELQVSAPGDANSVTIPAYLSAVSGRLPSCSTLSVSPIHPLSDFSLTGQ
jgi:hypothetical protein